MSQSSSAKPRLSLAAYIRLLTSCANRSYSVFKDMAKLLLDSIVATAGPKSDRLEITEYRDANYTKIYRGEAELPHESMKALATADSKALSSYFSESVIPNLNEGKKKSAVYALKNIILQDEDIDEDTEIGKLTRIKKRELGAKTRFNLADFLTDIFTLASLSKSNRDGKKFADTISKTYCADMGGKSKGIEFVEASHCKSMASIPTTAHGAFDNAFREISNEVLAIPSENDCRIFSLNLVDYDFEYEPLIAHVMNNLGYYVYSRSFVKELEESDQLATLAYRALSSLKSMTTNEQEELLGELLLYLFLEQVLGAPKLMSTVEASTFSTIQGLQSAPIHLLTKGGTQPFSKLVFGSSIIEGNLVSAISSAWDKLDRVDGKEVRKFVESSIFLRTFDDSVCKELASILLPKMGYCSRPESAYGIFLGYTLDGITKAGKTPSQFRAEVEGKMTADLKTALPFLEQKISSSGKEGQSFYIYLLPFADAETDRRRIMDSILHKGGVI